MTKSELFDFFTSVPNPDSNGQMKREKNFSRKYSDIYDDFCVFEFCDDLKNKSFVQKLWHFLQDDHGSLGLCKHCKKRSKFISFTYGYQMFCSSKCSNNDEDVLRKQAESQMRNCGGIGFSSKDTDAKIKNTMIKKYGVEYTSQSDELKEKVKTTTIRNFGGIGFSSKIISEKFTDTMNQRYGVAYSMQSKDIIEKRRDNKILSNCDFISIYDGGFTLRCTNKDCTMCTEKSFDISKSTYSTRLHRNQELCTKLNPIHKSVSCAEQTLHDYIKTVYAGSIVTNDRTILDGKEIDVYLPDLKIGFEFNGDYWHSNPTIHVSTDKVYHKTSADLWNSMIEKEYIANKKGVSLYNIWEHEWHNDADIYDSVKYIIDNNVKKQSPYFKIKTFINDCCANYFENTIGEFEFKNTIVKYVDCRYFNSFTCEDISLINSEKRVIYVYDFEINDNRKFEIVKSLIRHAFGLTKNKIYARKCILKEITNKEAKPFLTEHSLFGHRNAKITLGLFYKDELVMVYSFGHDLYGRKNDIEVIRACTKKNTVVIGGSSKCLNYFLNNFSEYMAESDLIFYVDRIHQDGKSLKNFEFIRHEYGVMNYWLKDYSGKTLFGIRGNAFDRMPSKHKEIKDLIEKHIIVSVKTMGVDVWKYKKQLL